MHGPKWVDDGVPVELIWRNARCPRHVIARADRAAVRRIERKMVLFTADDGPIGGRDRQPGNDAVW